jgi:hypothetical protein
MSTFISNKSKQLSSDNQIRDIPTSAKFNKLIQMISTGDNHSITYIESKTTYASDVIKLKFPNFQTTNVGDY